MGPDAMIFVFWMLNFKPTFSLSSFTLIKRFFSSSSLSAIRVVSSAYLRLLIFLPAIFIPAYASSSLAFHMIYSAYKLNKQGDNIQPWRPLFPIWNQSVLPCLVLIVAFDLHTGFSRGRSGGLVWLIWLCLTYWSPLLRAIFTSNCYFSKGNVNYTWLWWEIYIQWRWVKFNHYSNCYGKWILWLSNHPLLNYFS